MSAFGLRRFVRLGSRGALELYDCSCESAKAVLIEVDDGVVFVDEPNRAMTVLRLRDPIANRITSHVRLLRFDTSTNRPGPRARYSLSCMIDPRVDSVSYQRGSLRREGPLLPYAPPPPPPPERGTCGRASFTVRRRPPNC